MLPRKSTILTGLTMEYTMKRLPWWLIILCLTPHSSLPSE